MKLLLHRVRVWAKRILLPRRIAHLLPSKCEIQLVQVGSNDGKTGDPFHRLLVSRKSWRALFVEPVPYLFEQLRLNYGDQERFIFENSAISDSMGRRSFFYVNRRARVDHPRLPEWVEQLGSFSRHYLASQFPEILPPYIDMLEVPTTPLKDLLLRHGISDVDAIHIDTEGYDYEVLKQVDFSRYRPRVVLFEHKHLRETDRVAAKELMRVHGYRVSQWGGDLLCVLSGSVCHKDA